MRTLPQIYVASLLYETKRRKCDMRQDISKVQMRVHMLRQSTWMENTYDGGSEGVLINNL